MSSQLVFCCFKRRNNKNAAVAEKGWYTAGATNDDGAWDTGAGES